MPRTRKAPAPPSSESSDEEELDTPQAPRPETDTEDVPEPKKKGSGSKAKPRRRPSAPFTDASNDGFTVPLKDAESTTLSRPSLQKTTSGFTEVDDRAEKRKRRRSTRVSFAGQPDNETADASTGAAAAAPGDSAQDLNRSITSRPSMRTARLSNGNSLRINAVAPAPAPAISMDVMNTNFEEWMKMATDNVGLHAYASRYSPFDNTK